jgi:hypothetical protein
MSSHLHSLQTFSVSGVDSIQPYQLLLYLASKTSIGIYGTKKRLVSRNILMDHGCRPEKAAVFRFYTPWHGAAPVVHCSFRAAFRVRDRKAPRSRTSRIACSTNRANFQGCASLVLSQSGNVQYQKFRIVAEKMWPWSGSRSAGCTAAFWFDPCDVGLQFCKHVELGTSFIKKKSQWEETARWPTAKSVCLKKHVKYCSLTSQLQTGRHCVFAGCCSIKTCYPVRLY